MVGNGTMNYGHCKVVISQIVSVVLCLSLPFDAQFVSFSFLTYISVGMFLEVELE